MTDHSIRTVLDSLAREAGFATAGIAAAPAPGSAEDAEERRRFANWINDGRAGTMKYLKRRDDSGELLRSSVRVALPWARSVIVCAANYNSVQPLSTDQAPAGCGWIARYAITGQPPLSQFLPTQSAPESPTSTPSPPDRPSDYHKVLLRRLEALRDRLATLLGAFESRCFVDTGPVVERVYARYAGIGWVGKNTCILNQQLGSWLFLGVIVTSLELPAAPASSAGFANLPPDRCGSCTRCIDACPTGALTGPRQMDATRCIAYLTIEHRGPIQEELRPEIGRQVFGCDICQDVCPWNRRAPISADRDLAPRGALINPPLEWLASMNESAFDHWFNGSPIRRAKWSGFRRNLAIAMGNSGQARFLPILRSWSEDTDPVIAEAASWAARNLRRD
jgi:epoxyqueuosine reductase